MIFVWFWLGNNNKMFGLSRQISSRFSTASSRSFTSSNFPGEQLHVRQNSVPGLATCNVRPNVRSAFITPPLTFSHVISSYSGGPYPYVAYRHRAYSSASEKDLDKAAETHTSKSAKGKSVHCNFTFYKVLTLALYTCVLQNSTKFHKISQNFTKFPACCATPNNSPWQVHSS